MIASSAQLILIITPRSAQMMSGSFNIKVAHYVGRLIVVPE